MDEKIKVLKEKLQYIGTRDLLGMIGIHFITFANGASDIAEQSDIFNKTNLISPQKQYTYLAGLLMSTDDKSDGHITNDEESGIYNELENDVQEICIIQVHFGNHSVNHLQSISGLLYLGFLIQKIELGALCCNNRLHESVNVIIGKGNQAV